MNIDTDIIHDGDGDTVSYLILTHRLMTGVLYTTVPQRSRRSHVPMSLTLSSYGTSSYEKRENENCVSTVPRLVDHRY